MTNLRLLAASLLLATLVEPILCVYPNIPYGPTQLGANVLPSAAPFYGSQSFSPAVPLKAPPQRSSAKNLLQEIFQWNALEYNLPPYHSSQIEAYDPLGSIFTGLEFTHDKYFIAIPRLYPGVPATLAYIPRHAAGLVPNPKLEPFPSAEWQSPTGMDGQCEQEKLKSPSSHKAFLTLLKEHWKLVE